MRAVYTLTLRQLTGRWRLLIMTMLAALPVTIAALIMSSDSAPNVREFEMVVFNAMLAGSILPLVMLAIAAAAFSNEVEDRTLANLTLASIPRWQIVLPKLLATITIATPFIAASAWATSEIAFLGDLRANVAVTGASLIGVALYAAAFLWLGLVSTHAVGIGLFYIVLWEGLFSTFVAGVRLLSIRHFSIAWMHALDPRRFAAAENVGTPVLVASAIAFVGFVLLTIRHLRRMDVP